MTMWTWAYAKLELICASHVANVEHVAPQTGKVRDCLPEAPTEKLRLNQQVFPCSLKTLQINRKSHLCESMTTFYTTLSAQ